MRCAAPRVYVTGRYGSWAYCGCGWVSPLVHGGAIGATVAWGLHVRDQRRIEREVAELEANADAQDRGELPPTKLYRNRLRTT